MKASILLMLILLFLTQMISINCSRHAGPSGNTGSASNSKGNGPYHA